MTAVNPPSTPKSRNKTQAMNRVLDLIPKGYLFYTSGQVGADIAETLAQKFHDKYGIGCTPAQRITRKQHGKANVCLVMFWPENAQAVQWLLVATQGIGLESETMHRVDVKPRLLWLGYELVRYTARQKATWTWKRTVEQMRDWYTLLSSQLNQNQMYKVPSTLATIAHQPDSAAYANRVGPFVSLHGNTVLRTSYRICITNRSARMVTGCCWVFGADSNHAVNG